MRDILGINARSSYYLVLNKKSSRRIADSKLLTKQFLAKYKIPQPKLLGVLTTVTDIENFEWLGLTDGFVIKPVEGLGGEGIMVIKRQTKKPSGR